MNFGTSGDFDYLRELIERSRLVVDMTRYGQATKLGFTAEYYIVTLSKPTTTLRSPIGYEPGPA
jgi:hypothetical protein